MVQLAPNFANDKSMFNLKCRVMEAKKIFNLDTLIETAMDKLFLLFEYVYQKSSFLAEEPAVPQPKPVVPPIRFSNDEKLVEGELFG